MYKINLNRTRLQFVKNSKTTSYIKIKKASEEKFVDKKWKRKHSGTKFTIEECDNVIRVCEKKSGVNEWRYFIEKGN